MKINDVERLEKEAAAHDGKCSNCGKTIKVYRYKINRNHAVFLKAMAAEVSNTGVNDVDISSLGLGYSVRSQVTKLRQHGLIARVKNAEGKQIARRWLITHKGYEFLKGAYIHSIVVVYNNAVLGHDGDMVNIQKVLGEPFDAKDPIYTETPVSEPEARVLEEVRQPKKFMEVEALCKNRFVEKLDLTHELTIDRLQVGRPVQIIAINGEKSDLVYKDIAAFKRDWRIV